MPLHDAVGILCKKGATTEYQGADVKYMGYGVYVDVYVCMCYLTWHHYPSLVEEESHDILLLLLGEPHNHPRVLVAYHLYGEEWDAVT